MSTKYYVDGPDIGITAYDSQTEQEIILIDRIETQYYSDYWLCEDFDGNILICSANNLSNFYHR